jgi:hypothetical protein
MEACEHTNRHDRIVEIIPADDAAAVARANCKYFPEAPADISQFV